MGAQTEQDKRSVTSVVKGFLADEDLGEWEDLDSLSTMETIVEVEEAFNVNLPISDFEGPMSLEDFVSKVCRILRKRY